MEELKNFVRFAIHWSTILREYYIRQEELKIAEHTKVRLENLVDEPLEERQVVQTAIDYIDTQFKSRIAEFIPTEEKAEIEKSLFTATEAIQKHNNSIQAQA